MSITVTQGGQEFKPITIEITSPAEAELLQFALSRFIEYGCFENALQNTYHITEHNLDAGIKDIIQLKNNLKSYYRK